MTDARSLLGRYWIIAAIIVICVVVETALSAADARLLETTRLRATSYEYGGFWPGLLSGWQSNYPFQPTLMFLTYAFLHGGLTHLAVNMITLWSVGTAAVDRVGILGFLILYFGSAIGGAVGYGLLADSFIPMVGASGALFGVVGGLLAWNYVDRFSFSEALWPVARALLVLFLLNVVLWWAMNGQLAWQTHLGGFLCGWVLALLIDPRPVDVDS